MFRTVASRLIPRVLSHNVSLHQQSGESLLKWTTSSFRALPMLTSNMVTFRTFMQTAPRLCMLEMAKGEPLNDFEKQKLMRKFSLYDIDGDGHIEHEDYQSYINKIKEVYKLQEGDQLLHAFQQEFEAHWNRMLKFMDENKDGQLSLDEWIDFYPRVTRTPRAKTFDNLPKFLQTMSDAMFQLIDMKHDGVIDADEYREFWGKWDPPNVPIEVAREHVLSMTEGGKYKLTQDRYRDVMADFTWSKSEKTIGKYALGPLGPAPVKAL